MAQYHSCPHPGPRQLAQPDRDLFLNCSIVQRKLLTPNDFANLAALRDQLMQFQQRYQQSAKPFEWTFTRGDLDVVIAKLKQKTDRLAA
jgi:hypothetical protein